MRTYEAPELFVDEYVADTMIASSEIAVNPKNGNAANNQNCAGCDQALFAPDGYDNYCIYYPGDEVNSDTYNYNNVCR